MICNIVSVVDDDPMVRDSTVDLLNSMGFTALGFESAEHFIDSDEVKNTCCLITDQNLPGLSGSSCNAICVSRDIGQRLFSSPALLNKLFANAPMSTGRSHI